MTRGRLLPENQRRLIFIGCHPRLAFEAKFPPTLRTVRGRATEDFARAFVHPVAPLAQRIVRAKTTIQIAAIF